jgi:hypothetical protein
MQDNISRLDEEINKGWKDMIDLMSNMSFMKKKIGDARGDSKILLLYEIDKLIKEKSELLCLINELKQARQEDVRRLAHLPTIPIPPNNEWNAI